MTKTRLILAAAGLLLVAIVGNAVLGLVNNAGLGTQNSQLAATQRQLAATQVHLASTQLLIATSQKQSTETRVTTVTQRCELTGLILHASWSSTTSATRARSAEATPAALCSCGW